MITSGVADENETSPSGESSINLEQKYTFLGLEQEDILSWLRHMYVPHPVYSISPINSIYYDTLSFDHYDEKLNSDYLKTKVRLRWYEDLSDARENSQIRCFLEVKQKVGAIRQKKRLELSIEANRLLHDPFSDEVIQELPVRVYELSCTPSVHLVPMLQIRYMRYRFIDPQTHSGVALDTDISCSRMNSRHISAVHPVYLANGVLEIKGGNRGLLESLLPVSSALNRESFSKYARCLEMLTQPIVRRV